MCSSEDFMKALSEFESALLSRHVEFITMKFFELSQSIERVPYLVVIEML